MSVYGFCLSELGGGGGVTGGEGNYTFASAIFVTLICVISCVRPAG